MSFHVFQSKRYNFKMVRTYIRMYIHTYVRTYNLSFEIFENLQKAVHVYVRTYIKGHLDVWISRINCMIGLPHSHVNAST